MNITDLFIKRPVMTALVMIGIVLFGTSGQRSSERRFPHDSSERESAGRQP
jgi:hypothetical protein